MFREQGKYFVVFGKAPMKGFSKTRLAKDLGKETSLNLYCAFVKDFLKNLKKAQKSSEFFERIVGHLELFVTPPENDSVTYFEKILKDLEIDNFRVRFQAEKKFYERLGEIFKEIDLESENSFIHLTGTDIPDFPFNFLNEKLFSSLDVDDVIIGPDEDGGFYYLGMSSKYYNLFYSMSDEEFGRNSVFEELVNQCKKIGLRVRLLEKWSDIDTFLDLKKCIKRSNVLNIENTIRVCRDEGINL